MRKKSTIAILVFMFCPPDLYQDNSYVSMPGKAGVALKALELRHATPPLESHFRRLEGRFRRLEGHFRRPGTLIRRLEKSAEPLIHSNHWGCATSKLRIMPDG